MARKWSELRDKLAAKVGERRLRRVGDMVAYGEDLRNVECGECHAPLVHDGELLDVAFAVPPALSDEPVRCEPCARAAGIWED